MALLYSKQFGESEYRVRSAGASIRFYSNGVLHSQDNPDTPINGAIWDLLLLPGFFKETPPVRILVLGVGGGTIVHLLKLFFPQSTLVCVELDPQHIQIAKRYFKIPQKNVELIQGDAYQYLRDGKEKFDWIIDDVFQHVSGEPIRQQPLDEIFSLYLKRLNKKGMLSANVIGQTQFKQIKSLVGSFQDAYQFSHPLYENRILCLLNEACSSGQFRLNLKQHKVLDQSLKSCKLNYRLKKI